ncbi:MAG: hypothetical protein AAGE84_29440 [Cyanobacteria bacterium P01_G01_bin.39]
MRNTSFINSLMIDNFDIFKEIVADLKDLKAKLYNDNRRVHKPVCTYTAYEGLKGITADIQRIWNGRKIRDEKALELFETAIRKIHLLLQELRFFERKRLIAVLEDLLQKLVSLLPSYSVVQLELFAPEQFETAKEDRITLPDFKYWKWSALHRERQRVRESMFNPVKTIFVKLVQLNIPGKMLNL